MARTGPTPSIQEFLDLLGQKDMDTGPNPQSFIQDLLEGRGDQYAPGVPPNDYQGNENADEEYQVAGDVVPTSRYLPMGQSLDIQRRLSDPDTVRGSMGQLSIDTMGGPKSPYLDLMDVLMGRTGIRR
jgi:hypothetical protein